jgi:hypothetical protein
MISMSYLASKFPIDGLWFPIDGKRFPIDGGWFSIDGPSTCRMVSYPHVWDMLPLMA